MVTDKRSVLNAASDDDGEANTYDYKDSFIDDVDGDDSDDDDESQSPLDEDSDFDPEEDLKSLKKEAKGFMRNKKMQKRK